MATDFQTGQFIVPAASLTGSELVAIDTGGAEVASTTAASLVSLAGRTSTSETITAINTVGAGTLTAAAIVGGNITRGGAQAAAAFTDTTATAALILAALPSGAPVGTRFEVMIKNTTDAAETISAGVGVTLSGTAVIPKLTWATYLVAVTSATAVTMTFLRAGQISALLPQMVNSQTVAAALNSIQVGTLCGAQIAALRITGTLAPYSLYTPTATEMVAALPTPSVGMNFQFEWFQASTTSGVGTLVAQSGVTITGLATITGQDKGATFNVSIDSATAVTFTRVG